MTPTGNDALRTLDDLIARGEALIQARRNPENGRKTFADFGEAYRGWYIAGKELIAGLAGLSPARDWTARWCRGMHSLTDPGAASWLKEHERQQAVLVELRGRFGSNRRRSLYATKLNSRDVKDQELLADLRRVAKALGKKTVTTREYRLKGRYTPGIFFGRFGTWNKALAAAGQEAVGRRKNIPTKELFENLARVRQALGRPPVQTDMVKPQSEFSTRPYRARFGGWAPALKAFVAWTRDGKIPEEPPMPPKPSRSPSTKLRFTVFKRDSFKCTACGRSPATDPAVNLHVDHKIPWSRGGRTTLDNLTTLCEKCNFGKGNL